MFSIVVAVLFIPKDVLAQVVTEKEHYTLAESIQHSFVKKAWKYVLALLNGIVVLGLIIVALANILRLNIETYHIKRMLPSIIIGVILANFSYLICRVVIDLAQVVADFFISGVTGDDIVKIFGFNELAGVGAGAGAVIGVVGGFGIAATIGTGGAIAVGAAIFLIVAALIVIGIPTLLIFFLGFLLALRVYLIWFLVIVSPIAFFSLVFTPMSKVWQTWWSWFVKWVFLAPIAFLFIKLASIVAGVDWPEGAGPGFAKWFFGLVLFCLAIYIPHLVGGKIVSGWVDLWKKAAGLGAKGLNQARLSTGSWLTGKYKDKPGWQLSMGKALATSPMKLWEVRQEQQQKDIEEASVTGPLAGIAGKRALTKSRIGIAQSIEKMDIPTAKRVYTSERGMAKYLQGVREEGLKHQPSTRDIQEIGAEQYLSKLKIAAAEGGSVFAAEELKKEYLRNLGEGADISGPTRKEDPDWLKEAKDTFQLAYRKAQIVPGRVTGPVLPPEEGSPRGPGRGPGRRPPEGGRPGRPSGGPGGGPETPPSGRPDFAGQVEGYRKYIPRLQQQAQTNRLFGQNLAEAKIAANKLENNPQDPIVIDNAVKVIERFTPTFKTEGLGPKELLRELENRQDLGNLIRQNPQATTETIQQLHRMSLERNYELGQITNNFVDAGKGKTSEQIAASLTPDQINIKVRPMIRAYMSADYQLRGLNEGEIDRVTSEVVDQFKGLSPEQITVERVREVVEKPLIEYTQSQKGKVGAPPPAAPPVAGTPAERTTTAEKSTPAKPAATGTGGATGGGAGGTTPAPKPPTEAKPPAAGVEVTPRTIPELDEMLGEERAKENPDLDRIATLTNLRNELQQKGKRG